MPADSATSASAAALDAIDAELLPAAYARLRAIAAGQRRRLPVNTLNTTALVNEAFLRAAGTRPAADREHYFARFAQIVRSALIDHIRSRQAQKRAAPLADLSDADGIELETGDYDRLLAIDAALQAMAKTHARLVRVVEMRFFAGYDNQEVAELLGVNERTVRRDWLQAKAMLAGALGDA